MTGLPLRIALLHFLCLLFLTGLAGCGRKGPVQPRLAALPDAPTDVQIAQQGDDFLVSWTLPARNQDGAPAEDLAGFHIYRLIYNAAEGCPTCRDPEELVEAIELRRPEPAARLGKRLYWRDAAIAPGTGHAYLIAPVTVGGLEGATASLHRAWQLPPPPPSALQAEAGDHQVRLSWTPPAALPPGQQLLGYNLYRRPAAGTFPPIALNAEPLRETQLTDFSGEVGQEIIYRVTTVVESAGQQLESVPSPEAAVTPQGAR